MQSVAKAGDAMKILYKVVFTIVLSATPAIAVAQDWSGSSVGLDISGAGMVRSNVSGVVVPGRATDFTYAVASPNRSIDVERSSDPKAGAAVSYSRLWDRGGLVWGLEGEIGYGGRHEFQVGPYEAGDIIANGPGTVGSITKQLDTPSGTLNLNAGFTLKASAGLKIGDRALVSLFAGPTLVQADVKTTQYWNYDTLYTSLPPGSVHFQYKYDNFSETKSSSNSETLFGGAIGIEGRYKISEQLMVRAQSRAIIYSSIDMAVDAGGGETRLSVEPKMVSGSIGLLYRF